MPNNKDHQKKTGSQDPMKSTSSGHEFEGQGKNPVSGKGDQGQQASGFRKGTGSQGKMEDDEMNTAGGREGQFSDKNRGTEGQWSPGSRQSSDE
jgi:hypothetical protein